MRGNYCKGLSLIDTLTLILIFAAVATIAFVLFLEWGASRQKLSMLKELEDLNYAYKKYLSTGGRVEGSASAGDVVKQMNYLAFVEDDLYSREVGRQTFNLLHAPGTGFAYQEARANGAGKVGATGRESAEQMLLSLNKVIWSPEEYQSRLDALNELYRLGTLQEEDMLSAGLVWADDSWTSYHELRARLAEEGKRQARSGLDWMLWDGVTQQAFADLYPSLALDFAGPRALDAMSVGRLTKEFTTGFVRMERGWEKPIFLSTDLNPNYRLPGNGAGTMLPSKYVYVQKVEDYLYPPIYVGHLFMEQVLKWDGIAYYWQADLPRAREYGLFLSHDNQKSLRGEVEYVVTISNGERDNNPWSGNYGRVIPNRSQRMIISATPPRGSSGR
jgi:hypothetical protein